MGKFFKGISDRLLLEFDPERLGELVAAVVSNIVVGILVFIAFYLLWRLTDRILQAVFKRSKLDQTTASFITTILKFGILLLGGVQAVSAAGVNASTVVASLGLVGLTVGFAAKDALSNLISGLLIYWDRPFVIDDLVEVEGKYGRVERITLRSTRVVTVDGKMLAVPNSTIVNTTVASYTNFPHLRLDVAVNVGVAEDIAKVRRVLLGIVENDDVYMAHPAPRVVVKELNDYNVLIELQVWIVDERTHLAQRYELREKVYGALTDAGVDMPFETIQLGPVQIESMRSD